MWCRWQARVSDSFAILALSITLLFRAETIGITVTTRELKFVAFLVAVVKIPLGKVQRTRATRGRSVSEKERVSEVVNKAKTSFPLQFTDVL